MIKKEYDCAYYMPNEKTPTIRTGKFRYQAAENKFLTDVVIEIGEGFHRIYGKERVFNWHRHNCDYFDDFVERGWVSDYCINSADWYNYNPGRIARLFGAKPCKRLSSGWYMHKTRMKEVCITVYGGLIEEHY